MLFLLFHIGNDRYALEAKRVVEVIPLLDLKKIPQAPPGLAGLINYRGQPVPAVDLSRLVLGQAAPPRFSTRIVIVRCDRPDSSPQLVGLIAERATEILRKAPHEFVQTGLGDLEKAFLGPVLMDPKGPIQWIHEDKLLGSDVRQLILDSASPPAP
jgi:chemotaxis-related protein WspB